MSALRPTDTGWRDIATAPKDGTEVLLWAVTFAGEISGPVESRGPIIGSFSDGLSDFAGNDWWDVPSATYASWCKPTHWMPLPPAPTDTGRE